MPIVPLNYSSPGDTNGLGYYLGTNGLTATFSNPYPSKLNITFVPSPSFNSPPSYVGGNPGRVFDRLSDISFYTQQGGLPSLVLDLGTTNTFRFRNLLFRQPTDFSLATKDIEVQGSTDNVTWVGLTSFGVDDPSNSTVFTPGAWCRKGYNPLLPNTANFYRYIRIRGTRYYPNQLPELGGLVLSEIELYGDLDTPAVIPPDPDPPSPDSGLVKLDWQFGKQSTSVRYPGQLTRDLKSQRRVQAYRQFPTYTYTIRDSIVNTQEMLYLQSFYNAHGSTVPFRYRDRGFNYIQRSFAIASKQYSSELFVQGSFLVESGSPIRLYPVIETLDISGTRLCEPLPAIDFDFQVSTARGTLPVSRILDPATEYTVTDSNGMVVVTLPGGFPSGVTTLYWFGSFDRVVRFKSAPVFEPLNFDTIELDSTIAFSNDIGLYRIDQIELETVDVRFPILSSLG